MPRFVLLYHQLPATSERPSHWDLMLERTDTGQLATWALEELPQPHRSIAAARLVDHRADYLEYQGAVSNNRGTVRRIDAGTYVATKIEATCWVIQASGSLLIGEIELRQSPTDPHLWQFTWTDSAAAD
jgi:hypothetical protein